MHATVEHQADTAQGERLLLESISPVRSLSRVAGKAELFLAGTRVVLTPSVGLQRFHTYLVHDTCALIIPGLVLF